MKNILILITITLTICQACGITTLTGEDILGPSVPSIAVVDEYPTTSSELMTILAGSENNTWDATGFEINGIKGFQNCRLDDQILLNSDGTYSYNGGEDLCGAEDNVKTKTGTWEANFGNRTLTFDKGTDRQATGEIATATDIKLILRGDYMGWELTGQYEINL